jgi:hypothetical protein
MSARAPGRPAPQDPAPEELATTADTLRVFLEADETYQSSRGGPVNAATVRARYWLHEGLARLDKAINPERLPFGHEGRHGLRVLNWPASVQSASSALVGLVDALIERWDVPEVCEDQPICRGAGWKEPREPTLEAGERDHLSRIRACFEDALARTEGPRAEAPPARQGGAFGESDGD